MDLFKASMNKTCCVGGVHCPCCNPYHSGEQPKLRRIARRKVKVSTMKETFEDLRDGGSDE